MTPFECTSGRSITPLRGRRWSLRAARDLQDRLAKNLMLNASQVAGEEREILRRKARWTADALQPCGGAESNRRKRGGPVADRGRVQRCRYVEQNPDIRREVLEKKAASTYKTAWDLQVAERLCRSASFGSERLTTDVQRPVLSKTLRLCGLNAAESDSLQCRLSRAEFL